MLEIKRHHVNATKVENSAKHFIQILGDEKPDLIGTYVLLKHILLLVIGDFNIRKLKVESLILIVRKSFKT